MTWIKRGQIYTVNNNFKWSKSHIQVPVVDVLENRLRIYYATRNQEGISNIGYIEVDKINPNIILYEHNEPIFSMGKLGAFDDSGVMPSCIISKEGEKYLYYVGWATRKTVPYQNAVGLAKSKDGIFFSRISEGPIITINHIEPYFSGTSYVIFDENIYKMWYLSCIKWEVINGKPEPYYNIKYAESPDGMNWIQTGRVAIELENEEGGLVSASVIKSGNKYKMWFGKRKISDYRENINNTYRIGYAESDDGLNWKRLDSKAGIDISPEGWDSEMISYPYVVDVDGTLMMFYNGNGFGKTGFGYAIWENA